MQNVLIVGAGPTGLTLAVVLARAGVRARIIDSALRPPEDRSRAIVLQARTLEVFRDLGIDVAILEGALVVESAKVVTPGGKTAELKFAWDSVRSRFTRIISLPQDETERILAEHLATLGVEVERGVTLSGFAQDEAGVACTLLHANGRNEMFDAQWIVGADGAHSAVRHAAGLSFDGETYSDEALLGDVDIEWPFADGAITAFPGGRGFVLAFPLPGEHRYRIIMIRPAAAPVDARALSLPEFTQILAEMLPQSFRSRVRILNSRWLTRYRLHRRGVPVYRSGRAFVAGDAAHIHSPVGAQGMNTGIQDAYNLGWKLALVAREVAPATILDSYNEERLPVGHKLLKGTDLMFGFLTKGGRLAAAIRTIMPQLAIRLFTVGPVGRKLTRFVSQTTIRYRTSSLVMEGTHAAELRKETPRAGDRLPDLPLADGSWLHDAVRGTAYVVLAFDAVTANPVFAELARRYGALLRVKQLASSGELSCFRHEGGSVYLVRPDKHIGFRGTSVDVGQLVQFMSRQLIQQS